MRTPLCPYCNETFVPSRYRPDQVVCSASECQRERRAAYHRKKLEDDSDYREQCRESQRHWREAECNRRDCYSCELGIAAVQSCAPMALGMRVAVLTIRRNVRVRLRCRVIGHVRHGGLHARCGIALRRCTDYPLNS